MHAQVQTDLSLDHPVDEQAHPLTAERCHMRMRYTERHG
jgi:hypothetical protein